MAESQEVVTQPQQPPVSDKEINFRKLEERYERMLQEERQKRLEAETLLAKKAEQRQEEEEEVSSEPYVDEKRLNKAIKRTHETVQQTIQKEVAEALAKERQQNWIKQNPDFYDTMQYANALAEKDPELAETILAMPEGFERQKLVYKNIKAYGLHKKDEPKPAIQSEIDGARRKSLYYAPGEMGTSPYLPVGDCSPTGQKAAYERVQQLKARLRI